MHSLAHPVAGASHETSRRAGSPSWRSVVRAGRPAVRDQGSAVAEFVMVAGLVLVLGMAAFQLGLVLHVRNTLVASAAEGARAGARVNATAGTAVSRTTQLITSSLSSRYAEQVTARTAVTGEGVRVVEVSVTAPTPVIGLIGPAGTLTVTGRAFDERQVGGP